MKRYIMRRMKRTFYPFLFFLSLLFFHYFFIVDNIDSQKIPEYEKPNQKRSYEQDLSRRNFPEVYPDDSMILDQNMKPVTFLIDKKAIPGWGDGGNPVPMGEKMRKIVEKAIKKDVVNRIISDKIPLNRSLPLIQNECTSLVYDDDLPSASVVIIFTNEALSILLRTVWSVLNTAPKRLLQDVILVDDFSTKVDLQDKLHLYITYRFPPLVKLIRLNSSQGIMGARLAGARAATGDVLVFLDAHCEATPVWLEPLLQRIKQDRKNVVVPLIPRIDEVDFKFRPSSIRKIQVSGFRWNGVHKWISLNEAEKMRRKKDTDPARSPMMAGGLFAINREYFWEIGAYDDQMKVWGGENLDLSFRIWLCGGNLEAIPCSQVGHIYRSRHTYVSPNRNYLWFNIARVARVWMGDYKRLFYLHHPRARRLSVGDLSERMNIKERLECKDFSWYLFNIYPEKFVLDEYSIISGKMKNTAENSTLCIDVLTQKEKIPHTLKLNKCNELFVQAQFMSLSKENQLRREWTCARPKQNDAGLTVVEMKRDCNTSKSEMNWEYNSKYQVVHVDTGLCLDRAGRKARKEVLLSPCDGDPNKQWVFESMKLK